MNTHQRITRRGFNKATAAVVVGATVPMGCSRDDTNPTYEELAASTWRHSGAPTQPGPPLLRELVRYATLAANSHNTQPWRFRIETNRIAILPDFSRRCPAVDPDDHHLFVTLGCATENLALAAEAHGLRADVTVDSTNEEVVQVNLQPSALSDSTLFRAIPRRQSTRAIYDGKTVPTEQLAALENAAQDNGVAVQMFTDERDLENILEYVVAGNTAQMNDKAFVAELKDWIRFSESAAVQHRDGLFAASSGNSTLPDWLGKIMFNLVFKPDTENEKYRDHIRSSSGVIALVAEEDNKESWINVGRCCQRFSLQATAFGLRLAYINQPVEVPEVRAQFADYLGVAGRRPDLLLRFGNGPTLPQSLRRPVEQVILRG